MSNLKPTNSTDQKPGNVPPGTHLLYDMWGCLPELLNDHEFLLNLLVRSATQANATVLDTVSHQFQPQGITAIALLAESHLSIHTWPELGYVAVDVFTCGPQMVPGKCIDIIRESLKPEKFTLREVRRGGDGAQVVQ